MDLNEKMIKIRLKELLEGKTTYPTWTTNSIYPLQTIEKGENILVFYQTKTNKKISRTFPAEIILTPQLIYVMGFLKGEGPTSLGKSNYRRFTITNTDLAIIKITLNELEKCGLFSKAQLIDKSIHLIHHTITDEEVIKHWSTGLNIPERKFKCFKGKPGRNPYGVCHVYISNVLLRRVIDAIHEETFLKIRNK